MSVLPRSIRSSLFFTCVIAGCVPGVGLPPGFQPGSSFQTATLITLDANGKASISGNITGNKVDVLDLGPMAPGDRVIVTVKPTAGSSLDPVAALFDANQELFALNDDVNFEAGMIDSAINDVVVTATARFFFAITRFPLGSQEGAYDATIEVVRGQAMPAPPAQVLLLNFAGGSVTIPGEGTINVNAFDAAEIDAAYAGQTAVIKAKIIEIVEAAFASTGIEVVSSDDPMQPSNPFSTILFGGFSQTKFGVAQDVDTGNQDRCDDGIVFTEDFDKPFAMQPTVEGIGVAIGNVAAHEAGHLLGLNHVADVTDLMDTTGSASTLLANQIFKTSRLASSVFPIGLQNGPAMLNRVIPSP